MDIRYKLYSYPVLTEHLDDYIDSYFKTNIEVIKDINDLIFKMDISFNNEALENLINEDKIEFVFHIECPYTSYRVIHKTRELSNIKRIPESKLNGKVSICSFIIAKENIPEYKNHNFNSDYENMSFNISRGSILAIAAQVDVNITKEAEELSNVPSIFSILKDDTDNNTGINIEYNNDKIQIWLCNEDFYNYKNISSLPSFIPIIHAMIICPALSHVFECIKQNGIEEYSEYRWFRSIDKNLKKHGKSLTLDLLSEKSSYTLAQELLELPISRAFKSMIDLDNTEEDE